MSSESGAIGAAVWRGACFLRGITLPSEVSERLSGSRRAVHRELAGWRSVFLSLLFVSVLVLLDVTDTDKLGIYSATGFFSLLLPPKVNQGSRQPAPLRYSQSF